MSQSLLSYLSQVEDPRIERGKKHQLVDILAMSICATIGGAEGWEDIELFCKSKSAWLENLLQLENGVPSDDTFRRVISAIDPIHFQSCILEWLQSLQEWSQGQINVDGKTLRRCFENAEKKSALHLVQAWSVENHLTLAQLESEGKKNEIHTIPKLLSMLEISGCIVSIDAMGCQKDIAQQIVQEGGDYVLSLKANQQGTLEEVSLFLEDALEHGWGDCEHEYYETTNGEHGRIEGRKYWITSDITWMQTRNKWAGLQTIGVVESLRQQGGSQTTERRFYLSSLPCEATTFAKVVRNHWSIENSLHWVLDMVFREDESRIRKDHGGENFSWLRKTALTLLKNNPDRGSIKGKRKRAGWDNQFLEQILMR